MTFIIAYFIVALFGVFFWLGTTWYDYKYYQYWMLWTLLWPLGLLILFLTGLKQAVVLVLDIFIS